MGIILLKIYGDWRVMVLALCISSDYALYLYKVS